MENRYVAFDDEGYICAMSAEPLIGFEMTRLPIPDDFDVDHQHCYRLVDGELVLDEEKLAQCLAEEAAEDNTPNAASFMRGFMEGYGNE